MRAILDAAGVAEQAGVSNAQPLSRLVSQAVDSLSGTQYAIADAIDHVPSKPGLYSVYADPKTWQELDLEAHEGCPLYIGKAEQSLRSRDIRTHFATGRTGSSTVRRSFAALLRNPLGLRGVPRNMACPERPANFGLAAEGDQRLTAWMQERLFLAYWVKPDTEVDLMTLRPPSSRGCSLHSTSTRSNTASQRLGTPGRSWPTTHAPGHANAAFRCSDTG